MDATANATAGRWVETTRERGAANDTDRQMVQNRLSDRQSDTQPDKSVRWRGRAPKILGGPVNLPAETLEKGNATSLARNVLCTMYPSPVWMQMARGAEMSSQAT